MITEGRYMDGLVASGYTGKNRVLLRIYSDRESCPQREDDRDRTGDQSVSPGLVAPVLLDPGKK